MKDIHAPLRTLLYGIITGAGLKCYESDSIPENATVPYVMISDINSQEASNKTSFGNKVQLALDVVTGYPKNKVAGSLEVDALAEIVLGLINSKTKLNINNGLQIVNIKILQDVKRSDTTSTHKYYKRLIRFQLTIMEV